MTSKEEIEALERELEEIKRENVLAEKKAALERKIAEERKKRFGNSMIGRLLK